MRKAIICGVCVAALAGTAVRLELRNRVPWNSVVEINLSGALEGQRGAAGASAIPAISSREAISWSDLERAIDAARGDRRVGGLVLGMSGVDESGGRIVEAGKDISKELVEHIAAFRRAGKATVCIGVDEDNDGDARLIASACDKWMGGSVNMDEDVDDFFDGKFGEDNWSPINVREYLKRVGHLD